jgi:hypothetical protein
MRKRQSALIACFRLGQFLALMLFVLSFVTVSCSQQQPKSFYNVLTEEDSIAIRMDTSRMVTFNSRRLQMRITHPSFLHRQQVPAGEMFELFMFNDISLVIRKDTIGSDLDNIVRSPGQQFMGMGAELVAATDRYSIHTGNEDGLDYYAKVIDDSTRIVTLTLRYDPSHEYDVQSLRQWIEAYDPLANP